MLSREQHGHHAVVWLELKPAVVVEKRRLLRTWAQSSFSFKILRTDIADEMSSVSVDLEERGWKSEGAGPS